MDEASISDYVLIEEYRRRIGHDKPYADFIAAAKRIHEGIESTSSVDDFLNVHQKNPLLVEIGKAAIIRAVIAAAAGCKLYVDQSNSNNPRARRLKMRPIGATWFAKVVRVLALGSGPDAAAEAFNNVAFIVLITTAAWSTFLSTQDQLRSMFHNSVRAKRESSLS